MGWHDANIEEKLNGWWCGGICWESLKMAQKHQRELTEPTITNVTHDGSVTRHTEPRSGEWGLGVRQWFESGGQKFNNKLDAMRNRRGSVMERVR